MVKEYVSQVAKTRLLCTNSQQKCVGIQIAVKKTSKPRRKGLTTCWPWPPPRFVVPTTVYPQWLLSPPICNLSSLLDHLGPWYLPRYARVTSFFGYLLWSIGLKKTSSNHMLGACKLKICTYTQNKQNHA